MYLYVAILVKSKWKQIRQFFSLENKSSKNWSHYNQPFDQLIMLNQGQIYNFSKPKNNNIIICLRDTMVITMNW